MSRFVNFITTILGLSLIPYAAFLIYRLERFGSMDFIVVCVTGMFLIWFKDSSAKEVIEKILDFKFSRKDEAKDVSTGN